MKTFPGSQISNSDAYKLAATIQAFRQAYELDEVQQALRQCMLERECAITSAPQHQALYEHLNFLLSAMYQKSIAASAPIASALDALHESMSTSWVLLISPPE